MEIIKPLISVIIPVYNVEPFIRKCIDSIVSQSVSDWELLLIDDGSQDSSGEICDAYSENDSRIHVYHISNGGVSNARNYGLDRARGEWICFVDADDWIDCHAFELCNKYNEYDFIRFSIEYVYKEKTLTYDLRQYSNKAEFLADVISRKTLLGAVAGFYKRGLIESETVRFDRHITLGEDWLFLTQILNYADRFVIDKNCYYKYNKLNELSCTNSITLSKLSSLYDVCDKICRQLKNESQTSYYSKAISCCKAGVGYQIFLSDIVSNSQFIDFRNKLQLSFLDVLRSNLTYKQKLLLILVLAGGRSIVLGMLAK